MNKMNTNALVMPWHPEEPAAKPRKGWKGWASRFAGVWKDSRSAEDIVEDIRAARTANTFHSNTSLNNP